MKENQALCYTSGNYLGWLINVQHLIVVIAVDLLYKIGCSLLPEEMPNYKCDHRSKKISKKSAKSLNFLVHRQFTTKQLRRQK